MRKSKAVTKRRRAQLDAVLEAACLAKEDVSREVPYEFRIIIYRCVVWLYDNTTRTFAYEPTLPTTRVEALYAFLPSAGQECPNCSAGTVEHAEDGKTATCRGECGTVWALDLGNCRSCYMSEAILRSNKSFPVLLDEKYIAKDVPQKDAWDKAMEEGRRMCTNWL